MSDELPKYPSRAGLKLHHFLHRYQQNLLPVGLDLLQHVPHTINVQSATCMDLGAAHGGFTACLLSSGAKKVYAIDVAYGVFDWQLRNNQQVVLLERTNARHLSTQLVPEPIDIVTSDLSFISTAKVVPAIMPLLAPNALWLMMCKPQFEIKRDLLNSLSRSQICKGVIIDLEVVKQVVLDCCLSVGELGLASLPLDISQVAGREGNKEYWIIMWKGDILSIQILKNAIHLLTTTGI